MNNKLNHFRLMAVIISGLIFLITPLVGRASFRYNSDSSFLTKEQIKLVRQALKKSDQNYDAEVQMLGQKFSTPGYHTTLKGGRVHSTNTSLIYALQLLDAIDENYRLRAIEIIRKVISLQDTDRASPNFGLWSWYLEEPLKMMSPPDRNWADFCGKRIAEILLNHTDRLPNDLVVKMDSSLSYAAREIVQRNQSPDYTNIAVMGTFVTVMAGEILHSKGYKEYGFYRLKRFYDYTNTEGGFTEYNSPTYTKVAVEELNKMRLYFKDPLEQKMVNELYLKVWHEIAIHYHAPTHQWSGPHSRCYVTLLPEAMETMIRNAGVPAPQRIFTMDSYRNINALPDSLKSYFKDMAATRLVIDTFKRSAPPYIGTTYITPAFTLGSINMADMWDQRRDVLAYWGTENEVTSMQLRFMHNGKDFASAIFQGNQHNNRVLGGISLITNGGDTHPNLDKVKNGAIKADDICIRFQFEGAGLAGIKVNKPIIADSFLTVLVNGINMSIAIPYGVFDGKKGIWEYGTDENGYHIDYILYHGQSKNFDLNTIGQAAAAVAVSISKNLESDLKPVKVDVGTDQLNATWEGLSIRTSLKPYKR